MFLLLSFCCCSQWWSPCLTYWTQCAGDSDADAVFQQPYWRTMLLHLDRSHASPEAWHRVIFLAAQSPEHCLYTSSFIYLYSVCRPCIHVSISALLKLRPYGAIQNCYGIIIIIIITGSRTWWSLTLLVRVTCPKYTSLRDSKTSTISFSTPSYFILSTDLLESRLDITQIFLGTYISKLVTSACLYFLQCMSLNYNE